ncbi:ATP-binding protein [Bacillus salacetis]|uniref:ATP-binding protein n=1 Tax=Bacillus salacetis TaxID=2315464 RepID=A0A3A1QZM0_9BACI|nr:anti-sigma regulatory factor [Bacillus salacetis]RIW34736.1 ATP-binding protein [Bacillus salacetis]
MDKKVVVHINKEEDIIFARKTVRKLGENMKFSSLNLARSITSVSELARNIYRYAENGVIEMEILSEPIKTGIRITAKDDGPGIENTKLAMKKGYSSIGTLGAGLPGVQTMMDEFTIESTPGEGTLVTAVKWQLK